MFAANQARITFFTSFLVYTLYHRTIELLVVWILRERACSVKSFHDRTKPGLSFQELTCAAPDNTVCKPSRRIECSGKSTAGDDIAGVTAVEK